MLSNFFGHLKRALELFISVRIPPQRPALYAKVFIVLKSRVKRKSQTLA